MGRLPTHSARHIGKDLIHRDIKPENILLREGHAVVADFGIALAVTAAHGDRLTETGLSLGTPTYMSPEQIEGVAIDGRSDIYALGCVLFELITGRAPFEGPTPLAVAVQHQVDPPPDPREESEDITEEISQLILRCLEKEPGERYQTAEDLLAEIDRIRHPAAEAPGVFNLGALMETAPQTGGCFPIGPSRYRADLAFRLVLPTPRRCAVGT